MVQAFFGRILPGRRNHCAVFYLGAATTAADGRGIDDLLSNHNRSYRQLLLLQSTDARVVLAVNR